MGGKKSNNVYSLSLSQLTCDLVSDHAQYFDCSLLNVDSSRVPKSAFKERANPGRDAALPASSAMPL